MKHLTFFLLFSILIIALAACQQPDLPESTSSTPAATEPQQNTAENAQKITVNMSLGDVKQLVGGKYTVAENISEPFLLYQWELTNGQYLKLALSDSGMDKNPDIGLYVTEIYISAQSFSDTTAPRNTLENAQKLQEGMHLLEIIDLLGTNFDEQGSGAIWYEWELTNGQYAQVHVVEDSAGLSASSIRIEDETLGLPGSES